MRDPIPDKAVDLIAAVPSLQSVCSDGNSDVRAVAADIAAALLAAREHMVEWRTDMENAPREGDFLAFGSYQYPDDRERTTYMGVACWSGHPDYPWETVDGQHKPAFFTHWMPLPAPPEQKP